MSNKFNKKLSKYVELVLKLGVNIQKGQFLFISASFEEVELIINTYMGTTIAKVTFRKGNAF